MSNQLQNTPRGGKWASKFEDPSASKGKGKPEDVRAKKGLGQHFLNDLSIAERIANLVDEGMEHVLEIGPGMGVMTKFLFERLGGKLMCAEIDTESVEYLANQAWASGLKVWKGDFCRRRPRTGLQLESAWPLWVIIRITLVPKLFLKCWSVACG